MLFFLVITGLRFSTDAKSCYFAPYYDDNVSLLDAYSQPHVCASPVWTAFLHFALFLLNNDNANCSFFELQATISLRTLCC